MCAVEVGGDWESRGPICLFQFEHSAYFNTNHLVPDRAPYKRPAQHTTVRTRTPNPTRPYIAPTHHTTPCLPLPARSR